jgi:hypothetical protein
MRYFANIASVMGKLDLVNSELALYFYPEAILSSTLNKEYE